MPFRSPQVIKFLFKPNHCASSTLRKAGPHTQLGKEQKKSIFTAPFLGLSLAVPKMRQNRKIKQKITSALEQRRPAHAKPDFNCFRSHKWNLKVHMWYQLSPFTGSNAAIAMQHDPGNIQPGKKKSSQVSCELHGGSRISCISKKIFIPTERRSDAGHAFFLLLMYTNPSPLRAAPFFCPTRGVSCCFSCPFAPSRLLPKFSVRTEDESSVINQ